MGTNPAEMEVTFAEIEEFLKLLTETPGRLASVSEGLEDARMNFQADEKSWSANDVLAHLRSCADVWGKNMRAMLARDNPTLPYVTPRQWVRKTDYPELAFHQSLQAFADQRSELLSELAFEDWSRAAMIKGRKHTVFSRVRQMAQHENGHCEQIEALLK